jgi:hypothetical protein
VAGLGWPKPPLGPTGVVGHPLIFNFFKTWDGEHFFWGGGGGGKSKWSNCNNLEVWGEGGVKCHVLNIEGQNANIWVV